jgi:hypothetical protein
VPQDKYCTFPHDLYIELDKIYALVKSPNAMIPLPKYLRSASFFMTQKLTRTVGINITIKPFIFIKPLDVSSPNRTEINIMNDIGRKMKKTGLNLRK